MDNANRLSGYRRLMAVEGVGYNITIANDGIDRSNRFAIDNDITTLYSIFLEEYQRRCSAATVGGSPT